MRFTAWFKQWFSRRSVGSDHLTLEIDAMVQKFQIVKEAKRLATMGLPAYHEKKPTQKEWEVVEHLNAKREDIHHHCVSGMEALEARLVALELKHQAMQTEALNAEFERQTRRLLDEEGDWLKKLAYNATLRFKELEHFKKKHDLVREANFPSATGLMLRYSILLFLIGIEGALNAHFFAEGLSTGLIGGFVYAALLAGINVMGCFFLGRFAVPWVVSKSVVGKLLGSLAVLFAGCFMVSVALSIGHVREALMAAASNPTQQAWVTMQNHFWGLNDLASWFLVAISLGFGLAALIDGMTIDDIYPGYGAMVRRCNQTREEFEAEFEDIREELESLKQEKLDLINQGFKLLHELLAEIKTILLQKESLFRDCHDKLGQTEVVLYAVIRKFRLENEIARSDGLRPSYFDSLPSLNPITLPRVETDKENALMATLNQDIKMHETTVHRQREKVYTLYEQTISRLNHLKYQ